MMKIGGLLLGTWFVTAFLLFSQQPSGTASSVAFRHIVDLTHTLDESTPTFEETKEPVFRAKTVATIEADHYFARELCLPEHFGTHLDAPAHFAPGHWTVEQIPPERFVAPLVVLDLRSKVEHNPDYRLSTADLVSWEQVNRPIPASAVVIARTGWESRWNSAKDYRNPDSKGVMHFPGYSLEAAKVLIEERKVYGLGIDTLSIDYGPSPDFPVHRYSLAHDVYHLENVTNLDHVPGSGAQVLVAPMKLGGGSGSPVRILALVR
ncbi:MAG: cyclase family protein [Deltaproteobacteria bacterium]|nr:cyclase family protein [Deltaproteobacteria bacterium]